MGIEIVPGGNPQKRTGPAGEETGQQQQAKAGCGGLVPLRAGPFDLVQTGQRQPAAGQAVVQRRHVQGQGPAHCPAPLEATDRGAQGRDLRPPVDIMMRRGFHLFRLLLYFVLVLF